MSPNIVGDRTCLIGHQAQDMRLELRSRGFCQVLPLPDAEWLCRSWQ